jgi:hypothetical protein
LSHFLLTSLTINTSSSGSDPALKPLSLATTSQTNEFEVVVLVLWGSRGFRVRPFCLSSNHSRLLINSNFTRSGYFPLIMSAICY